MRQGPCPCDACKRNENVRKAAPELLEALKITRDYLSQLVATGKLEHQPYVSKCNAAIAKAEGRS